MRKLPNKVGEREEEGSPRTSEARSAWPVRPGVGSTQKIKSSAPTADGGMLVCALGCSQTKGERSSTPLLFWKTGILIYSGYGHLSLTQGPLLFPECPQQVFGLCMSHPAKKRQVEKERLSSSGSRSGWAKSRKGLQVKGLIPMRLGSRDFSDLGSLWPYCVWEEAFKRF